MAELQYQVLLIYNMQLMLYAVQMYSFSVRDIYYSKILKFRNTKT